MNNSYVGFTIPVMHRMSNEKGLAITPHSYHKQGLITVYWPTRTPTFRVSTHPQYHIGFRVPCGRRVVETHARYYCWYVINSIGEVIQRDFVLTKTLDAAIQHAMDQFPDQHNYGAYEIKR